MIRWYGIATAVLMVLTTALAQAETIRVSQESAPGAGDFDSFILGTIDPFPTGGDAASFYNYGGGFANPVSYGNANQNTILTVDTSHLFLVSASDGLSLFIVHDRPNVSGIVDGGADMQFDLAGDTADFLVQDDPFPIGNPLDGYSTGGGGTTFTSDQLWGDANTDGLVLGSLDGAFTMFAQFTQAPLGLVGGWQAISVKGSIIPLDMTTGRRVRLDTVPEPASFVMFASAIAAVSFLGRRNGVSGVAPTFGRLGLCQLLTPPRPNVGALAPEVQCHSLRTLTSDEITGQNYLRINRSAPFLLPA